MSVGDSTRAALNYLAHLHDYFHGNWLLAIAAYNAGEGTVQDAVNHNLSLNRRLPFGTSAYRAKLQYVPKLLALAAIVARPAHYHLSLTPIPNKVLYAWLFCLTNCPWQPSQNWLVSR